GLLTPTREWVAERHSESDRRFADMAARQGLNGSLTFGDPTLLSDWAWLCDRSDAILTAKRDVVEHLAAELGSRWSCGDHVVSDDTVKYVLKAGTWSSTQTHTTGRAAPADIRGGPQQHTTEEIPMNTHDHYRVGERIRSNISTYEGYDGGENFTNVGDLGTVTSRTETGTYKVQMDTGRT